MAVQNIFALFLFAMSYSDMEVSQHVQVVSKRDEDIQASLRAIKYIIIENYLLDSCIVKTAYQLWVVIIAQLPRKIFSNI